MQTGSQLTAHADYNADVFRKHSAYQVAIFFDLKFLFLIGDRLVYKQQKTNRSDSHTQISFSKFQ